jgi:hypothetical protein
MRRNRSRQGVPYAAYDDGPLSACRPRRYRSARPESRDHEAQTRWIPVVMADAFLSYSRTDEAAVRRMRARLAICTDDTRLR